MGRLLIIINIVVLLFVSCNRDEALTDNARIELSSNQIILNEDRLSDQAILITWENFAPGEEYVVEIANLYSVGWNNVWSSSTMNNSISLSTNELQNAIISLGKESGSDVYIKIRVRSISGDNYISTEEVSAVVRLFIPSFYLKVPVITASTKTAVLSEANKMKKALELSWSDASIDGEKVKHYILEFANASDTDFAEPIYSETITEKSVFYYQLDLNLMLQEAGAHLGSETSLIYRINAVPENVMVKGSISATNGLSVTSYTKPVPSDVQAIYIAGSGVDAGWSIPSEVGKFENIGNGIYEWTGHINDGGGTFKVLFNGGWSAGFRHGDNDYYWEDAQYVTNIGDSDYGVVLCKGVYKLTVDINKGTLSREIVQGDRKSISITECKNWRSVDIPSINESNTLFQGNVSIDAEAGFIVVQGDGNRNWVRRAKDSKSGISFKMSERRSKESSNESNWFYAPESRSYKVTVDIQNNILTLE